jgi:hypothetical protein
MTETIDKVDENIVLFAGTTTLAPGELELQSFKDRLFGRRIEDVQGDWTRVSGQIAKLVDATASTRPTGFDLDSIEFSLAFTASGKLAFIAEAGVEASVSVSLKRQGGV